MGRRWRLAGVAAVAGLVAGGTLIADGSVVAGIVELVVFVAVAVLFSPLAFPRSAGAREAVERSASDGRPIIYWRPGCRFCLRLRVRIGGLARRAHWVDIWRDPEGAAAVRAVTGGDETVPTVVAGAGSWVNPGPQQVRELLRGGR
jgi:mycoredoxin